MAKAWAQQLPHTAVSAGPVRTFVYVAAVIAALSGFLFGYDTGVISGALLFLKTQYHLSPTMQEVVTSVVLVGATVGAASSGRLADRLGRRTLMIATALLFLVGILLTALSPGVAWLIVGRVIVGLAIGVASYLGPLYISEIAPASIRGALVALNQFLLTLGILISYGVDYALAGAGGWRWMFGLAAIPSLILGVGMFFLPESPRWLIQQGREDEARRALQRMEDADQVQQEVAGIRQGLNQVQGRWSDLLAASVRPALRVGLLLAVFQQITGINTIIYYAPTIFQMAGFGSAAHSILATVIVGVVNVIVTLLALRLLDRVGRRPLLLWGLLGMIVGLALIGFAFHLPTTVSYRGWLAVACLMLYVGCFAIGLGPVFWLLISEIYPLKIRGLAMSVATLANWGFNLLVSLTFLTLIQSLGPSWTFWLYGLISILCWLFVRRFVPETKGRSLEQIEQALASGAAQA